MSAYNPDRYRKLSPEQKAKHIERAKAWNAANRDRHREISRDSARRHKTRVAKNTRASKLRKLGWTYERYHWQVMAQGCKCAICGDVPDGPLHADHCHASGAPRALLCGDCNRGLGLFRDRPELLLAGGEYLRKFQLADPE